MSRQNFFGSAAVTPSYFECKQDSEALWPPEKCKLDVDDPLEARTWASKAYLFEVDNTLEARTREIVFFENILPVCSFRFLFVNWCQPEPF